MKYREYRVGDLFEIMSPRGIFHANQVKIYDEPTQSNYPYIVRTSQNNGIRGYLVEDTKKLNTKNTISFAQDTAQIFYQTKDYFTGNKMKVFRLKDRELNRGLADYLITSMRKSFSQFGWGSSYTVEKLKNVKLFLPVKTTLTPDFSTLEAILTGGIDMSNIDTSNWKEFKIGELFDYQLGDVDLQAQHINNKGIPVITSGEQNRGILGETSKEAKVIKTNSLTIDMFGHVYYRDFDYKLVTHARVFALIPKYYFNKSVGLFLESYLSFLSKMYSYNNMCSFGKIKDLTIKLPVKETEEIDYEFMENYIRDLERERIRDLERERIRDLESYLKVTGLDNIELTQEEQEALMKMRGEMNEV